MSSKKCGTWSVYESGAIKSDISHANKSSSPFANGGSRGILLCLRLPEDHRSIFTLQVKETIPPAEQVGFETTKSALTLMLLKMLQLAAGDFNYSSREFK